jgi:hypothetical protein
MSNPVEEFIVDLLAAVDIEADGNPHALQLSAGLDWIVGHADRSAEEKLTQIIRLCELQGSNTINLRDFTNWKE